MCNQEFKMVASGNIVKHKTTNKLYIVRHKDVLPLSDVLSLYGFRCISLMDNEVDIFLHKKNYFDFDIIGPKIINKNKILIGK